MTFGYNPASQIVSRTGSNDAYSVTGLTAGVTDAPANGLNQLTASGAANLTYDPRGNLTSDGSVTYAYNSENQLTSLVSPSQSITFSYDPLMRLAVEDSTSNGLDASLAYDGPNIVQEALSDGRTRRYVYGPGTDEVLYSVLLRPTASTIYYWHHGDERGSIVRTSDETGAAWGYGRYDEYGAGSGSVGRFRYTGQYWLGEGGLHSFRARIYHAGLGRFLQTDPIGYGDGMNMYAYVRGDPVNRTDPSGMCTLWSSTSYSEFQLLSGGGLVYIREVEGPRFYTVTDCELGGSGRIGANPYFAAPEDGAGEIGDMLGGGQDRRPRGQQCVVNESGAVHVQGTISHATGAIGGSYVSGTITNVNSGNSARFSGFAFTAGAGFGRLNFSGSFRSYRDFTQGWDFRTAYVAQLGLSDDSDAHNFFGTRVGEIDIDPSLLAVPIGAVSIQVDPIRSSDVSCEE